MATPHPIPPARELNPRPTTPVAAAVPTTPTGLFLPLEYEEQIKHLKLPELAQALDYL